MFTVFISASTELEDLRDQIYQCLHEAGIHALVQGKNLGETPGTVRDLLARDIEHSDVVLHLAGDHYGADAGRRPPPFPETPDFECSWTQFEYYYAHQQGKDVYAFVMAQGNMPEAARPGWTEEDLTRYQALQQAHRQRVVSGKFIDTPFAHLPRTRNHPEAVQDRLDMLKRLVAVVQSSQQDWGGCKSRIQQELTGLIERLDRIEQTVTATHQVVTGTAQTVLATDQAVQAIQRKVDTVAAQIAQVGQIDASKIRAHLLTASENARARDLAEAEQTTAWQRRDELRQAAEAAHAARLARIDTLAADIAEIEGRGDASTVMREMTRILREESVDAALAYLAQQRGNLLSRVRARVQATSERNRIELEPLLTAAGLERSRGNYEAARAAYQELLALEPNWPRALLQYGWFLYDRSMFEEAHGSLASAVQDATIMLQLADRLHATAPAAVESDQRFGAAVCNQLGNVLVLRGLPGDAELALNYYQRCLEISERLATANPDSAQAQRDVSVSLEKLGDFLSQRGLPGDAELALSCYQRSLDIRERLTNANPDSAQALRDVSVSLNKLGDFLCQRGLPGDADLALKHYQRDLEISERLATDNPDSAQALRDVSVTLSKLGDFLSQRGLPGDAELALNYYKRSLDICERRANANSDSAEAQRDVSVSLSNLGDFLRQRGLPGDAELALNDYQRSLEIDERLATANPDSAQALRDVSVSLNKLGDFLRQRGLPGDAELALNYYQRSLDIRERLATANPDSAQAKRDLMVSLERIAAHSASQPEGASAALNLQTRALGIALGLRKSNPQSVYYGRTAAGSLYLAAQYAQSAGQDALAIQHVQACYEVLNELHRAGCRFDPWMSDTYAQLKPLFASP